MHSIQVFRNHFSFSFLPLIFRSHHPSARYQDTNTSDPTTHLNIPLPMHRFTRGRPRLGRKRVWSSKYSQSSHPYPPVKTQTLHTRKPTISLPFPSPPPHLKKTPSTSPPKTSTWNPVGPNIRDPRQGPDVPDGCGGAGSRCAGEREIGR